MKGKTVLITGAARRVGRHLARAVAWAGGNVVVHHANSPADARAVADEIEALGQRAWVVQADFAIPGQAESLIEQAFQHARIDAVVHNAAIFEPLGVLQTTLADWQRHMDINLTAPFLISREFAAHLPADAKGRIVTLLDWRALRPGADHFAYTVSKAALAAMTRSLAAALAPRITVNGLALGAILPAIGDPNPQAVIRQVPAGRWATLDEVGQTLLFLLDGPEYITGEILHVDGGRHLV